MRVLKLQRDFNAKRGKNALPKRTARYCMDDLIFSSRRRRQPDGGPHRQDVVARRLQPHLQRRVVQDLVQLAQDDGRLSLLGGQLPAGVQRDNEDDAPQGGRGDARHQLRHGQDGLDRVAGRGGPGLRRLLHLLHRLHVQDLGVREGVQHRRRALRLQEGCK